MDFDATALAGVSADVAGRSIDEVAAERDRLLLVAAFQQWKFRSKLLRPSYRQYKLEPWLHIDPRFCVFPPVEGAVQPSS
jgi:hypothetical protein